MVFESETPDRRAQNMSALLALIILVGVVLPIPIGAGFADWTNEANAPVTVDNKYIEIGAVEGQTAFEFATDELLDDTGYKPYFTWWNDTDASLQKHNVSMATHKLTAEFLSEDDLYQYSNNDSVYADSDDAPQWDNGFPYWEVYFNYTAKTAYDDGVVKIDLVLDSAADWENATGGKGLLSRPVFDDADKETVTITLTAGGVTFYSGTIATSEDGDIDEEILVSTALLREAIIGGGATSYFKLKVTGHDVRPMDMTGSAFYSYNVNKLYGRDDGLYLASMISVICAALGVFLVQPRYNLPFGSAKTRKRGY